MIHLWKACANWARGFFDVVQAVKGTARSEHDRIVVADFKESFPAKLSWHSSLCQNTQQAE
jgi:hypothetical protein